MDGLPGGRIDHRTNLPLQLTTFVGRQQEVEEATALLEGARLLTLVGAGGVGKTRLALRVAESVLDAYSDGVWQVELASVTDPAMVTQAVASVLGVVDGSALSLVQALVRTLGSRESLLLLDNCEHVVAACAELADHLLHSCARLRILATSRQSLGVAGEVIWRVPSLPVPGPDVAMGTDEIGSSDGVRLFVDRARSVLPAFSLDDRNASVVAAICRSLDGIPLAIELAAARLRTLAPRQVLDRLDDRFRVLSGGSRTTVTRQQTLRATLDWSCELLTAPEQLLFARLSVFAGGWDLEAAEAITADGGFDSSQMLPLLSQLIDKSMVEADTQRPEARYRYLETIRQYAHERLLASGEAGALQSRHASYFVMLAERAKPGFGGPEEAAWFDRLDADHDNLRAALRWLLDAGQVEASQHLSSTLGWFWMVRGHRREGQQWLEESLLNGGDTSIATRASAVGWLGRLADTRSDYTRATEAYTESLALLRELRGLGDRREMAALLEDLGRVEHRRGHYAEAVPLLEESLQLSQQLGDRRGIAFSLSRLGRLASDLGDDARAEACYLESLALLRELGDRHYVAHLHDFLGALARKRGEHARAAQLHTQSLAVFRELGDKEGMGDSLNKLARLAHDTGDLERALTLALESAGLYDDLDCKWGVAESLEALAGALAAQGRAPDAVRLLGAGEGLREFIGVPLPPTQRPDHQRAVNDARRAIRDGWKAIWAEGRTMSAEQAVDYVRQIAQWSPQKALTGGDGSGPGTAPLSRREQEVARLIVQGCSNRQISELLVISERTTEAHVTHVLSKLGLRSRAQIAVWATQQGFLAASPSGQSEARVTSALGSA